MRDTLERVAVWTILSVFSAATTFAVLALVVLLALVFPWVFFIALATLCGLLIWCFS